MHHVRCKIISYSTGTHLQTKEQLLSCSAPEQAAASYRCWGGGGRWVTDSATESFRRQEEWHVCLCVWKDLRRTRVTFGLCADTFLVSIVNLEGGALYYVCVCGGGWWSLIHWQNFPPLPWCFYFYIFINASVHKRSDYCSCCRGPKSSRNAVNFDLCCSEEHFWLYSTSYQGFNLSNTV